MNSNSVMVFFVIGISLVNGTGHGYLFGQLFDYLHQHREPLREIMLGFTAVGLFIGWLAFEKAKIDEEEVDL